MYKVGDHNENKQLFASKYRPFLPDEKQLINEIESERQRFNKKI